MKHRRILALSPHPGDAEFGAGGTILKMMEQGSTLFHVVFSLARASIPDGYPLDITKKEAISAAAVLGISDENLIFFDFDVRHFPAHRQSILDSMVKLRREISPDLVFLPSSFDTHQDHHVVYSEGFRAFKYSSMLGYEMPRNSRVFHGQTYFCLEENHLEGKQRAMACYETHLLKNRETLELRVHLARVRGIQIGQYVAECFEAIRWIL